MDMAKDYIEKRDGGYWVAGSRVSLDSLVYAFLRGASPENIAQSFPLLNLEQVFGAIAFYLANQTEIDSHLRESEAEFESTRAKAREENPLLYQKLDEARLQTDY
jgi:uncharacterized protein (DUF433 family)